MPFLLPKGRHVEERRVLLFIDSFHPEVLDQG
jgi:hypothetical protein